MVCWNQLNFEVFFSDSNYSRHCRCGFERCIMVCWNQLNFEVFFSDSNYSRHCRCGFERCIMVCWNQLNFEVFFLTATTVDIVGVALKDVLWYVGIS